MVDAPCSKCVSSDVCKYKDKFCEAKNALDDTVAKYDNFMSAFISCRYYRNHEYSTKTFNDKVLL